MTLRPSLLALLACATCLGALAADHATKDQAVAMVKKGVALWKSGGDAKAIAAINDKSGPFRDRDLYLVAYGMDGTVLAHGGNERMVGKNLIELKDVDGKAWVKERVDLAQTHETFWQDYKMTDPLTKKIEPKESYCERVDKVVVCGGVYKQ